MDNEVKRLLLVELNFWFETLRSEFPTLLPYEVMQTAIQMMHLELERKGMMSFASVGNMAESVRERYDQTRTPGPPEWRPEN